jgi:1-acylglycerone phosphate reductase
LDTPLPKNFARQNYHVYATARKLANMGDLASTSPDRITPLALDVRSPAAIQSVYTQIQRDTGGKLDILYHNAGYRSLAMATEASCDESMKMFNTNVFGVIKDTRIFADLVVAAKGKMVFTGSVSGYTPHPSQSVYCSSTAALELYVRTLRIEMRPFDVQVILVNTGATKTGMSSQRVDLVEGKIRSAIDSSKMILWTDCVCGGTRVEIFLYLTHHQSRMGQT